MSRGKQNLILVIMVLIVIIFLIGNYKNLAYGAPGDAGGGVADPIWW